MTKIITTTATATAGPRSESCSLSLPSIFSPSKQTIIIYLKVCYRFDLKETETETGRLPNRLVPLTRAAEDCQAVGDATLDLTLT